MALIDTEKHANTCCKVIRLVSLKSDTEFDRYKITLRQNVLSEILKHWQDKYYKHIIVQYPVEYSYKEKQETIIYDLRKVCVKYVRYPLSLLNVK